MMNFSNHPNQKFIKFKKVFHATKSSQKEYLRIFIVNRHENVYKSFFFFQWEMEPQSLRNKLIPCPLLIHNIVFAKLFLHLN